MKTQNENGIKIEKQGINKIAETRVSYSLVSSSISSFFWHPVVGFAMLNWNKKETRSDNRRSGERESLGF
jgi:hypothetical protein